MIGNNTMKIGTIDGISFEKSRSHQEQSLRGGYNNMRSHGYFITEMCKRLDVGRIYFSIDKVENSNPISDGSDDFVKTCDAQDLELRVCTHKDKTGYGILVQTLVDVNYIDRLYDFVDSVEKLYIYSSDYEYELRENTFGLQFLFEFMRSPGEHQKLVDEIKKKLVVAFCGWFHIAKITPQLLGIPCEFVPQLINPSIEQVPHSFDRPYDGFFMGMNSDTIEFMNMSGNKKFLSVQYRDYSVPHTEYRNVTQIQQAGICTDIRSLVTFGGLCKFHCITNSWKNLYPTLKENSDMFVNQTFKIFEAFYSGMYPINPAMDWKGANLLMNASEDQYIDLQYSWRRKFSDNYSLRNYLPALDKWT